MLKKKLAITIASIAAASFILGTMCNLSLITIAKQDDDPRPVWPTYITGVDATALPDAWNVTVTNWPVSTDVNVWWERHISPMEGLCSPHYKANGFSQLHVLMHESGLHTTWTVRFSIFALLWNGDHTNCHSIEVAEVSIDGSQIEAAITIPVPSEEFYFVAWPGSECDVSLSFYLT